MSMLVINIYRPPNLPRQLFEETLVKCQEAIDSVIERENIKTKGAKSTKRKPHNTIQKREQQENMKKFTLREDMKLKVKDQKWYTFADFVRMISLEQKLYTSMK